MLISKRVTAKESIALLNVGKKESVSIGVITEYAIEIRAAFFPNVFANKIR